MMKPLVMVMDRDGKNPLRMKLADHIIIQNLADFHWRRNTIARFYQGAFVFFTNDIHAQLNTLIANEHCWSRDQLSDLMLAFAAEGAVQGIFRISTT